MCTSKTTCLCHPHGCQDEPSSLCADVIHLNTAGMWVPVVDLSFDLNHSGRSHECLSGLVKGSTAAPQSLCETGWDSACCFLFLYTVPCTRREPVQSRCPFVSSVLCYQCCCICHVRWLPSTKANRPSGQRTEEACLTMRRRSE
jgi:hypothetical protein